MKKIFILALLSLCLLIPSSLPVAAQDIDYTTLTESFTLNSGEKGQELPTGAIIQHFENGETKVYDSNKSLILKTGDDYAALVTTPSGSMKANHVYGVPDGTEIYRDGNILTFFKDKKLILTVIDRESDSVTNINSNAEYNGVPGIINAGGWVEYARDAGVDLDYFSANWTCPSDPPTYRSNVMTFLFIGISPMDRGCIIQPVLQWNNEDERDDSWTGCVWYACRYSAIHSAAIDVSTGDSVTGYMSNITIDTWYVDFRNNSTSTSVSLAFYDTSIFPESLFGNEIYCTLESYYYHNPNAILFDYDMPGDTTFSNINITLNGDDVDADWDEFYGSELAFGLLTDLDVDISGSTITLNTAN